MNVSEFEKKVWEVDRLCVRVKAPSSAAVKDFDWVKAANQGMRVAEYLSTRIIPRVAPFEVDVIDGKGGRPHGLTLIGKLRQSYGQ